MKLSNIRLVFFVFIILGAVVVGHLRTNSLNEIELVSGIGIDRQDDAYSVTLQVFNPSANQKNSVDPTGGFTYTQTGSTIPEAIQKIKKDSLKEPILDTLQVVALSDTLAKEEGLEKSLDFLIRDPRVSSNVSTIIIRDVSPEVYLTLFTPQQKLSSLYTNIMIKNAKDVWGKLVNTSSERIKSYLEDHTSDFVIPYVEIHGDVEKGLSKANIEDFTPDVHVSLEGFVTFKGDKVQTFLTQEESNTLALIKGINQVVSISTPCPDAEEDFTIDTINTSSSLKVKGDHTVSLQVKVEGNLEQLSCKKQLPANEMKKVLQNQLKKKLTSDIEALIKKAQEEGTDIVGVKDAFYRQEPKVWKEKKTDPHFFSNVKIETDVNVVFIRFGHIK
ncbi:Ger(x)C family spore germination protein [Bacillus sp. KH172YL63]|uniref:Ger(x)C family spore germination protein n=1 Tax=Bacillus sp. KH172YL63 TaxID=2709784 RepID=UPI0013E45715|nr:Ger(x)C family spore germination protein [Bacillus sp. KH172YL63]BCB04142.1 spore germination protein KC [Bacillus sp. KH172YL63]